MIPHSLVSCALISSLYAIYVRRLAMAAVAIGYFASSNMVWHKEVESYQGGNSDKEVAPVSPFSRLCPRLRFVTNPQFEYSHNFGITQVCCPQNSFHRR